MNKKLMVVALLVGIVLSGSAYLYAATPFGETKSGEPVDIEADEVTYDWKAGKVTATGKVVANQSGDRLQGDQLEFFTGTNNGFLLGNVVATRSDGSKMVTSRLDITGGNIFTGSGGVDYSSPENSLQANWLQYNQSTGYIQTKGRTTLIRADGMIKADQVEAWQKTEQVVGRGNVDFVSKPHSTIGKADHMDYQKAGKEQGIVTLTGNAQVVHKGENMITGPKITIDLDSGYAEADGRPTLVITPQK